MAVLKKIAIITLGAVTAALSINLFLAPNRIAPGGVTGIATILHYILDLPIGLLIILVNIPLFLLALKQLGAKTALYSIYGFAVTGLAADYIPVPCLTNDLILAAIFGGIMMGIGYGLTLRAGGNTGGTDLIALFIKRELPYFNIAYIIFALDFIVVAVSAVVFDLKLALYAMVALYASTKILDLVVEGISTAKAVYIITDEYDGVSRRILSELERGVTKLNARGMYSGQDKGVLYCILQNSREVAQAKNIVKELDPKAFVVVNDVQEVLGEGFTDAKQ